MTDSRLDCVKLPFPEKGDRRVWIFIPAHEEGQILPVIYMTDGQNLFHDDDTPYGCWEVIPAIEGAIASGGAPVAVVGIDNGNIWRENELSPKSIGKPVRADMLENLDSLQGEVYESFLLDTVIPYVREHYPVTDKKEKTAFCGSSMGGLYAYYMALEHSDMFIASGVFSPATLLYDEDDLRAWTAKRISEDVPYLYIYTGAGDELEERICQGTELTYQILEELGYPYDKMSEVVLLEEPHNERAWAKIFPDFLGTFLDKMKNAAV